MSSGDQSLKKSDEGLRINLRESSVSSGMLSWKDRGCVSLRGRHKEPGWEEGSGHGSCLDSGTGKTWAQIQTPLTVRVWAYCWRPLHLHFHIYKMVTNILIDGDLIEFPKTKHSKCLDASRPRATV